MKVYLATSGEYSDYRVRHVFTRREDAENYPGADDVDERTLRDGPVEMRDWHALTWNPGLPDRSGDDFALANPFEQHWPEDYDPERPAAGHRWHGPPGRTGPVLEVQGWDLQRVRKTYSEQRAQHLAREAAIMPQAGLRWGS